MPASSLGHEVYRSVHDFVAARNANPLRRHYANIMLEGDSWFGYPGRNGNFFRRPSNLFEALQALIAEPCNWFDAAMSGDTTADMARHQQRLILMSRRRIKLDLFFVSAGGNDVFDHLGKIIKPADALSKPAGSAELRMADYFSPQLAQTLSAIDDYYQSLKARRDRLFPGTPLISHDYAAPIARKRAFSFLWLGFSKKGPWVNKALDELGYKAANTPEALRLRHQLINYVHEQLSHTLKKAMPKAENCYVYSAKDRQLSLSRAEYWDDEIHLNPRGNLKLGRDLIAFLRAEQLYRF